MPVALKASWTVVAGIIPGQPMAELSKKWLYTSLDYEKDTSGDAQNAETNIFTAHMKEASDYMLRMNDPRQFNWARMEFIWY